MKLIPGTDLVVPDTETHLLGTTKKGRPVWRGYQHDHTLAALAHLSGHRLAVDAGAHVGLLTRLLARYFDKVVAFEPSPASFLCLVANTKHLPNVECHCVALGAVAGSVAVEDVTDGNTGDRQVVEAGRGLPLRPLDDFPLEDCDFLKLDVQGYEHAVLRGAHATLGAFAPVVLVEVEPPGKLRRTFAKEGAVAKLLHARGAELKGKVGADQVWAFGPDGADPYPKYATKGAYHWAEYVEGKTRTLVHEVCAYVRGQGHASVLDVGCGDGLWTAHLGPGALGVDNNAAAVALAVARGARCVHHSAYHVRDLGRWDAVCLFDVFEHLHRQELLLRILHEVTDTLYVLNPRPKGGRWHTREFEHADLVEFAARHGWRLRQRFDYTPERQPVKRLVRVAAGAGPERTKAFLHFSGGPA